ncbi:MAG TPA: sensor histidine kinase [Anaerolineae bacterium]|nr:sensor histidine kinase [Anaerolineae bacterium]MCB0178890.1 sensor histidine kinase [Anaerolineae bacterium]MCB0223235.1 sensor histidine kinase [Anaerolineae bacterium]MCB9108369.1 sensor histidine kinase [Anaerolineales bacterium]HRV95179.1 sensor histidine kinase [Anaerolineae bacterium]
MDETVTQLKTALAEKEMQLKEMHHQVKINLQIITSLLNLQLRRISDAQAVDALTQSNNRVYAIALIHEKLYSASNSTRLNLVDYARDLARYLFYAYQAHFRDQSLVITGSDVAIDINQLVPCGLIINELVTNALTYAFPAQQSGQVSIQINALPDQRCQLIIGDNGVGLPPNVEVAESSTLGLKLVTSLTQQLIGTLTVQRKHGTTFIIEFPISPSV